MSLLDFIFPPRCVVCNAIGGYVCAQCLGGTSVYTATYPCAMCAQPVTQWNVCSCSPTHLDGVFVAVAYTGIVEEMIHAYKYEYIRGLEPYLSCLLEAAIKGHDLPASSTLVPVPMTARKQKERGFNQAEVMARSISDLRGATIAHVLKKTKDTAAQMTLAKNERMRNAAGAYAVSGVVPSRVILVDDVMTTGSTLNECARVLKDAGTTEVYAVVLAHGEMATTVRRSPNRDPGPPSSLPHRQLA